MNLPIKPISLFGFGEANLLHIRLIADDLESSATFFYQLGRTVKNEDETVTTVMADNIIGNVTLDGDTYKQWPGSNATIADVILAKLPGTVTKA
tara:strand:- start:2340 stop:2621 length:282 start_codon:yes stop_codon:yes gene_type:complete